MPEAASTIYLINKYISNLSIVYKEISNSIEIEEINMVREGNFSQTVFGLLFTVSYN